MDISCISHCLFARDGGSECYEYGKLPETLKFLVRAEKSTSVGICKPVADRTRQDRLHVQLIAFIIVNDLLLCMVRELHFGGSAARVEEVMAAKRSKVDLPPQTLWIV